MNAQQLADLLREQATSTHQIRLSTASIGTPSLSDLVTSDLRRADGTLILGVDPAMIPKTAPAGGFTLGVTVPRDPDGFLGVHGRAGTVQFLVGTGIDVVMAIGIPDSPTAWTIGTSFPEAEWTALDDLTITGVTLAFSTVGKPPAGLTLGGTLGLAGPFAAAVQLVAAKSTYPIAGPASGSGDSFAMELTADLELGAVGVPPTDPVVTLSGVGVGVGVASVTIEKAVQRVPLVYLDATVAVRGADHQLHPVTAQASMPVGGGTPRDITLSLVPGTDGLVASLSSLGSMIAGASWDEFFSGPAFQTSPGKELKQKFDTFGLKSYSATFDLPVPALSTMTVDIGTGSPWTLWDGYTVTVDASWTVLFLPSGTSNYLLLSAAFDFRTLAFVITIDSALRITGRERGQLPALHISDLNATVFEGKMAIPDDLLVIQVGDFSLDVDITGRTFAVGAVANASVSLFHTQILAVHQMAIGVSIDLSGQQATYVGRLDGQVSLGSITFQADAVLANKAANVNTVFSLHLVDETVGSLINHLIHLVDPTYDLTLPDPWSRLLAISLDALVLKIDVTAGSVTISYASTIDLGFLTINSLGLSYTKAGGAGKPSSTQVEISGTLLGASFGTTDPGKPAARPALAWDPVRENPPSLPGKGSSLFDLRYVALGQHVGFLGKQPATVGDVMTALKKGMTPVQPGQLPPFGGSGDYTLSFKADSDWLIGADLTVADTVSLTAIFNDPDLYGVLIQLSGAKAKIFAGLSFEILYRKVTDTIGVYHVELKLPDAMRHLEFGEVSVTLPVVVLDVYTNGNFRIDFGFPKGLDFSRSFSVQVFPFVGYGGFYLAVLDGATSSRVPQITNGAWSPIIEFGVALSIGVGKTIDEGILSGGITVTVVGILQGVLAWFHPTDSSPAETYYWIQGTIAVTGHLYATIDFAIIQASVDVTAYIGVTLTLEAHQPIYIEAKASVSVRVSVKIVFFTIHFSFDATVDASFTIGSASPTPWKVASGASPSGLERRLRGQATLHSPAARHAGLARALRAARAAAAAPPPITSWPPVPVLGGTQALSLWALTGFTTAESWPVATAARAGGTVTVTTSRPHDLDPGDLVILAGTGFDATASVASVPTPTQFTFAQGGADTSSSGGTATAGRAEHAGDAVMLLAAQNSIPNDAVTGADHHRLAGESPGSAPFNVLMKAMLLWGIVAAGGRTSVPDTVSADLLARLRRQLQDPATIAAAFDYTALTGFLAANVTLDITPGADQTPSSGVALFPMIPAITLTDTAGANVDFETTTQVGGDYVAAVRAYFAELQVQFDASDGDAGGARARAAAKGAQPSMAMIVFGQYFNILMSTAVKAAIDMLAAFPVITDRAMGIHDLGLTLGEPDLEHDPLRVVSPTQDLPVLSTAATLDLPALVVQVPDKGTFTSIAAGLAGLGARTGTSAYSASDLIAANVDAAGIFVTGAQMAVSGITYGTQPGDTLDIVISRLLVRAAGPGFPSRLSSLSSTVQSLLEANRGSTGVPTDPDAPIAAGVTVGLDSAHIYTTVAGDTLSWIGSYLLAAGEGGLDVAGVVTQLLALNPNLPTKDPAAVQPVGTQLTIPPVTRACAPGDSVATIAQALVTTPDVVSAAVLHADGQTPVLRALASLTASVQYPIQADDTFAGIAAKFDLTLADVATQAATAGAVFAAGETLIVGDVGEVPVAALTDALLAAPDPKDPIKARSEWNQASAMVSRFLLAGLRLPDPGDGALGTDSATVRTKPMLALTGQRWPAPAVAQPPATPDLSGYEITLTRSDSRATWLTIAGSTSAGFALTPNQATLLQDVAWTAVSPRMDAPVRLALYRMAPLRLALPQHVAWQATTRPAGCLDSGTTPGTPSLWPFPDALVLQIQNDARRGVPLLYQPVVARHHDVSQPITAAPVSCYAWATLVRFTVSRPQTDGTAASVADAYVVEGADDVGAALLQDVHAQLEKDGTNPTLFLLYPPDANATNPTGLASDALDPGATFLLKTNLSTLTHSGGQDVAAMLGAEPTDVYAAPLGSAKDFIALLWEASITRSGGFYLQYSSTSGGGVPATAFGSGSSATLSLLVLQDGMKPYTNCTVIGDNIDTTVASVLAQPAAYGVQPGDSLTVVTQRLQAQWGAQLTFTVPDVAVANQDVPLLLAVGAHLAVPAQPDYVVRYGDTFSSVVEHLTQQGVSGLTVAGLFGSGANATNPILAAGASMQLVAGVLEPVATVPPGVSGFEVTRAHPDPANLSWAQLKDDPAAIVGTLYNLLGWSVAGSGPFRASGQGLPTTPTAAAPVAPDGLALTTADQNEDSAWYYSQVVAVAGLGSPAHGSASPALPPAAANPYNGIGWNAGTGALGEVAFQLWLQDIYGNAQPLPQDLAGVAAPVGYYDDVIGPASWPGIALSYVLSGSPPAVTVTLALQQTSYVPSSGVSVPTALTAIAADLARYRAIHYQLAQPDLTFALQTTLALDGHGQPVSTPLAASPFEAFARGAYVYLAARSTLEAVGVAVTSKSPVTIGDLTAEYGVTGAALFSANEQVAYESWFGTASLVVPVMYSVVSQDSLDTIAALPQWKARYGFSPAPSDLAAGNAEVPLAEGVALTLPSRTAPVAASGTLADTAQAASASVAGIAIANQKTPGVLAPGKLLTLGTAQYPTTGESTFLGAAGALGGSVSDLALANQHVPGLLLATAGLAIDDRVTVAGDTWASLAAAAGQTVGVFARANAGVAGVWPVGTQIRVGTNPKPTTPAAGQTLGAYATANAVSVEQLGDANASAGIGFAPGAQIAVPGALQSTGATSWSIFAPGQSDRLEDVAAPYGVQPVDIATLNADIPGLLRGGETVRDTASGASLTTRDGDSFADLITRFAALSPPVTVSIAELAGDVATQAGLLVPGEPWIAPTMRADAGGRNAARTLSGLAAAYGTDVATLATANAATIGFLAPGCTVGSVVTTASDTLSSLVTRGVAPTVAEVAELAKDVAQLVAPTAPVMPVPPLPSRAGCTIVPQTAKPVFQVSTTLTASRDPKLIDPDFTGVSSVAGCACSVPPEPDPSGNGDGAYSLVHFARALEAAVPGLHVAVGDPVAEGDAASLSTVWAVNLGASCGPALAWEFQPSGTNYFALPPLSRSLMGGQVDVPVYLTGKSPPYDTQAQNFQGIDLDTWLNTFAAAVDLFLSPAYAVPAYALAPAQVQAVVAAKKTLAGALSKRLENVLTNGSGSRDEAQAAMCQALLAQLGAVSTVSTVVQVPVQVSSPADDPLSAPRLSGKVLPASDEQASASPFTFSTAKVSLTATTETSTPYANVLFSAKSPAAQSDAQLDLLYSVTELELPDPSSRIGDYEGSSWLKFVDPVDPSTLTGLTIPVPLRAYPSPVTLVAQQAAQSVADPAAAPDLLPWDLSFVYQHDDAAQDTPLVEVTFNGASGTDTIRGTSDDPRIDAVFRALAGFTAVWPALRNDLALLPAVAPGNSTAAAKAAVEAFAELVGGVASAFTTLPLATPFVPPAETFWYQLQRTAPTKPATQGMLTVTSVDPATGQPEANPVQLWPTVFVDGFPDPLKQIGKPSTTSAEYAYPAGMSWEHPIAQRFVFAWDGTKPLPPEPTIGGNVTLVAPQTFQFAWTNAILRQNARAGVSIWRNLELVPGRTTTPDFVYQTPVSAFSGTAAPSIVGGAPIGLVGSTIAEALGTFLEDLVAPEGPWPGGTTLTIRLVGGYTYAVAATGAHELTTTVPILLVASYDFDPAGDWEVAPGSFVSQVQDAIETWATTAKPSNPGASYVFDLTVFAGGATLQPLIHVTTLRYPIPS